MLLFSITVPSVLFSGLEHLGRRRDLDRFGDLPDLQGEIEPDRLLNLDLERY